MVDLNKMKKMMNSFKGLNKKVAHFFLKTLRTFWHAFKSFSEKINFKRKDLGFWILDGLVVILIIFLAVDIFHKVQRPESVQYYTSPAASPEISMESPREAEVGVFTGEQAESKEWKALTSFGGVGSGTSSVFSVAPQVRWRIVLTTKTDSGKTSALKLLIYHKEYPQEPVENFTKELEHRGNGGGRGRDAIEICDTTGGNYVIDVKSVDLEWDIKVEILED